MKILGVNGIHNWSWSKNSFTDKLLDALSEEHEVIDIKYRRMWAFLAYFDDPIQRRADKILEHEGDILIAHSFGCLASIYAMRKGAKFDKVFFFGAAAECDVFIPDNFNVLYNIHSDSDRALSLGRNIPLHPFGCMGKDGYSGRNEKVINVPANGLDHNDYVSAKHLCKWVKFIKDRI
jgi:hypothetical protein